MWLFNRGDCMGMFDCMYIQNNFKIVQFVHVYLCLYTYKTVVNSIVLLSVTLMKQDFLLQFSDSLWSIHSNN
jgi:hypothetical protein